MWLYLLIFFIPVLAFYSQRNNPRQKSFLILYMMFLAFFVGMSDMFGGYDRYIYTDIFDGIANVTTHHGSYMANDVFRYFPSERGFIYLNIFISFFTENRYIFILIITLLIYFLLFQSFKKYANNYAFAMILFMGLWFYFSFTYLRQVLGASIAWLSIKYIIDRKLWKFLLVLLIAMSVHKSAIILLPVYFMPIKKYPTRNILYLMLFVALLGISPIPNAIFSAYGDISVVEMQGDYNSSSSFRFAYALEALVFLYIIIKRYRYIPNDNLNIVMLNLALFFCATLLFFVRSPNGGRLSWYFMLGLIVTISNVVSVGRGQKNWSMLMIVLCLFLNMRIFISWQHGYLLYPYKTFLTNGYRDEDKVNKKFEYDEQYAVNKFYRAPFRLDINLKP